jgi:hypothetical protein
MYILTYVHTYIQIDRQTNERTRSRRIKKFAPSLVTKSDSSTDQGHFVGMEFLPLRHD